MLLLFGFLSGAADKAAAIAIKCLAVGGGFLAGYLLSGGLVYVLDRWLFAKKTPDVAKRWFKLICGIIAAIVTAMLLFGDGSGSGGGSGNGDGKSDTGSPSSPSNKNPSSDASKLPVITSGTTPRPYDEVVRVTILGGNAVMNERFYMIDDDKTPKTFDDLKTEIRKRKTAEKRKIAIAVSFQSGTNRLPVDHGAVTQLKKWALDDAGLDVLFSSEK